MLPYMILMIALRYSDTVVVETSTERLLPDGFSVRISKNYGIDKPESVECRFLRLREKKYEIISITEFDFQPSAVNEFYNEFSITSKQPDFLKAYKRLTQEYMEYICLRQQDEYTMMNRLTGFSFDGEMYPHGRIQWKREQREKTVNYTEPLLSAEIAICLDSSEMWDSFLRLGREEFLQFYWKDNALDSHPIHCYPVTHVYIGNAYCPVLMPNNEKLVKILNRAKDMGMIPVVVFSTMPVRREKYNETVLLLLAKWCIDRHETLELVLNDIGMALQLKTLAAEQSVPANIFRLTAGTLLTKRKKDFRIPYVADPEISAKEFGKTAVDTEFYRDYLQKRLGFESISYESCGYEIYARGPGDILHLPLYQMNTSGYCTMYALCQTGDRGCQSPVSQCPEYCADHTVLFPERLPAIGLWNSLFGCDMTVLSDVKILNKLIRQGIRRLVIRL